MENRLKQTSQKGGTAKDYAYTQIKQRIIEGKLYPNQPIREEEISSKLNISRTPLRGALEKLEFEKLVVRQSNGRLKISPISVEEVKEIFKVRSKLEEIAVVQATENANEVDSKHLLDLANEIKRATADGDIEKVLLYGAKFHTYIYDLSGNKTVKDFLSQLNDHIQRYRYLVPSQSEKRMMEEGEEHLVIVNCIANKDAVGAEAAMKKHIDNSLSSAVTAIEIYEKNQESIW
ncbi:GntR family transcriptional regulator [Ornithinibacillus salinisoli]|uniref:GntR family transcriptional regulator n=1 Tax=Ornithinibacillus salinisoli TaxID=1848459 RepID=A0ABW4W2R3_9BACI